MSDLLRMTGMYSGMDTEAVIQSLVAAKSKKVTTLKNDQKKLEWKQDIWQKLNTKIYSLYSKTLSNLRFSSSFAKKKTKVSDPTKASIIASEGAVNGSQTLKINKLAKSAYLTGAAITKVGTGPVKAEWDENTSLSKLGDFTNTVLQVKLDDGSSTPSTYEIKFDGTDSMTPNMTLGDFVTNFNTRFQSDGIKLEFNKDNQTMTLQNASGRDVTLKTTAGEGILRAFGLADISDVPQGNGTITGETMTTQGKVYGAANNWNPSQTRLVDINPDLEGEKLSLKLNNGTPIEIEIDKTMTINNLIKRVESETGGKVKMTFDRDTQQFTVNSGDESLSLSTTGGTTSILQALGLDKYADGPQTNEVVGDRVYLKDAPKADAGFESKSLIKDIDSSLVDKTIKLTVGKGANAKTTQIKITSDMKISDLLQELKAGGVNATFDETNQRFFISATGTGTEKSFTLGGDTEALMSLGMYVDPSVKADDTGVITTDYSRSQTTMVMAQDAEIVLNGAKFTSASNTFSINGLSITANALTNDDEPLTITTDTDYDGIYETIKDFLTEYNDVMNEMYKLYSADSARKYDMLTDEQKESMSDDEVEKWEDTIKGALLRRDNTLYSVMNSMRSAIDSKYTVNGQDMYLKNLGIGTLSYFTSTKENRYSLHIDGDPDDEATSSADDVLKTALAKDPESVIDLFTQMAKKMYDSLHESMGSTEYSSIYKVYDDKRMKIDYDDYTKKIKEAEKKLSEYEDKWYKKFSAMEVALSKLQSNQNTISSMLGM